MPNSPHPPSLIITGATASVKASAHFSSFAAGKFALRGLSQSLAREFGPRGVHVAHAIVDGLIDTPRAREYVAGGQEAIMISPDAVGDISPHTIFCAILTIPVYQDCRELLASTHSGSIGFDSGIGSATMHGEVLNG